MRESWTDGRLDDLNGKVDALRLEMRTEFVAVRGEMRDGFDKVDARFLAMDARLIGIYRTMVVFCGTAIAALIGFIATQV